MSFAATHLIGFGSAAASAAAGASVVYAGAAEDVSASAPTTFSNAAIGTASATRYVAVVVAGYVDDPVSSLTVAGQACTLKVSSVSGSSYMAIFLTNAPVTSGTTANVVINWDAAGPLGIAIATYAVKGIASTTATNTQTTTTSGATMSLSITAGGVAVAAAFNFGGSGFTTSGVTENVDSEIGAIGVEYAAGCTSSVSTTTLSISFTAASPSLFRACCVSFL